MFHPKAIFFIVIMALAFMLSACSHDHDSAHHHTAQSEQTADPLTVYKSPNCGCCDKWQDHLTESGVSSLGQKTNMMSELKTELGIQREYQSCHTGVSKDGYVFEGHVPAKFIQQFLQKPPAHAIGLAVPAMPIGSPGMEVDDGQGGSKFMAYKVLLLKQDGSAEVFADIQTYEQQF